jgi:protein-tyrosine phosphatase
MLMITEIPLGIGGRLFRSRMPFALYDPEGQIFSHYQSNDVSVIVLLTDDKECLDRTRRDLRTFYQNLGFEVIYLPIPDFSVPSKNDLEKAVENAIAHLKQGKNTVVHCYAGVGRTGMFIACLAKKVLNMGGDEAIKWVRQFIPGAVEIEEQRILVREL